jgi:hypothetical protein
MLSGRVFVLLDRVSMLSDIATTLLEMAPPLVSLKEIRHIEVVVCRVFRLLGLLGQSPQIRLYFFSFATDVATCS